MLKVFGCRNHQGRSKANGSSDLLEKSPELRSGRHQRYSRLARTASPCVFRTAGYVDEFARLDSMPFELIFSLSENLEGSREKKKALGVRMAVKRYGAAWRDRADRYAIIGICLPW